MLQKVNMTLKSQRNPPTHDGSVLADDACSESNSDQLRPEEKLVENLCKYLLPTDVVIEKCGGISNWQTRVCSVLSFSSSVSSYPTALHELRVCNDFAMAMLLGKCELETVRRFLTHLADAIILWR
jgi:hypothetical protein